jgi:hypothetical protein
MWLMVCHLTICLELPQWTHSITMIDTTQMAMTPRDSMKSMQPARALLATTWLGVLAVL